MTFDEWFSEIENFSSRGERFFCELMSYREGNISERRLVEWLQTAYRMGVESKEK